MPTSKLIRGYEVVIGLEQLESAARDNEKAQEQEGGNGNGSAEPAHQES